MYELDHIRLSSPSQRVEKALSSGQSRGGRRRLMLTLFSVDEREIRNKECLSRGVASQPRQHNTLARHQLVSQEGIATLPPAVS